MDETTSSSLTTALTGATGFIGRRLQAHLRAADHPVRALVRRGSRNGHRLLEGVDRIEVELDDLDAVARAVAGTDVIVHCAGSVRGRRYDDFRGANVTALETLCAARARSAPAAHLILVSSLAATRPDLSDYARSKRDGEACLGQLPTPDWTVLRPPAVYGPGDREMLPLFRAIRAGLALAVGPPGQRLSLLHVDDLARAVLAVMAHRDACRGRTFAIDDGTAGGYDWESIVDACRGPRAPLKARVPYPVLLLAGHVNRALSSVFGYAPMLTPGKVRELSQAAWLCDNSRFVAATAWRPSVGLRQGVAELFAGRAPAARSL